MFDWPISTVLSPIQSTEYTSLTRWWKLFCCCWCLVLCLFSVHHWVSCKLLGEQWRERESRMVLQQIKQPKPVTRRGNIKTFELRFPGKLQRNHYPCIWVTYFVLWLKHRVSGEHGRKRCRIGPRQALSYE